MEETPLHVHVIKLIKHVSTTPLDVLSPGDEMQLKKRMKKRERRRKKTQELLGNVQRGLKKQAS